jgi:hypothetical protein
MKEIIQVFCRTDADSFRLTILLLQVWGVTKEKVQLVGFPSNIKAKHIDPLNVQGGRRMKQE